MGGFLSGLGTLLGGFHDVRRIDKEGFDWREQAAQREFERQREREQYGTELAADYLTGAEQPDEATAATAFGPDVDRARMKLLLGTAAGKAAASKPAIESMKANTALMLRALTGEQQAANIQLRGDEQQALARVRAELDAGRQPNARDRFIADEAAKRTGMTTDALLKREEMQGARQGNRLYPMDRYNAETGQTERTFVDEATARRMAAGEAPGVPRVGATEQNRRAAANASIQRGESLLKDLNDPDFKARLGPVIGRYNTLKNAVDAGDPYAQYLVGELRGWSALQPQIHGFRSAEFVREIERLINTRMEPEALAATLEGLLAVSYTVRGQQQPRPGFLQKADERSGLEDLAKMLAGLSPEERQQLLGGR